MVITWLDYANCMCWRLNLCRFLLHKPFTHRLDHLYLTSVLFMQIKLSLNKAIHLR